MYQSLAAGREIGLRVLPLAGLGTAKNRNRLHQKLNQTQDSGEARRQAEEVAGVCVAEIPRPFVSRIWA